MAGIAPSSYKEQYITPLGSKSKECPRSHVIVTRAEGSGDNYMWSEAVFICSRGAYTIFFPGETENTTFAIGRREQKWHFRPARQKKS